MDITRLEKLTKRAEDGGQISRDDALWLAGEADFESLLFHANRLREKFHGNVVQICSVINARCGACSQPLRR